MNSLTTVFRARLYGVKNISTLPRLVLGIETSCDDTGAAVMDENGTVHGEALKSQMVKHLENGGIMPHLAKKLHEANIHSVVEEAMKMSGKTFQDLSAVATTVKPGLTLSLSVGLNYSKQLVSRIKKPFIPIHHMEAHALTARAISRVEFPYLVLLASGGHCQIAVVKDISRFSLLGYTIDVAPGEAFDKVARRLKLKNLAQFSTLSGGEAIEVCARGGDPMSFEFAHPISTYHDCNFSFGGLRTRACQEIAFQEKKYDVEADGIIPNCSDLCASFQHAVVRHIARRLQRAMIFCETKELLPATEKTLVASGGVLCNQYLRNVLGQLCSQYGFTLVCPPPKLCTDNGIMIAWNGIEKLRAGVGIEDVTLVEVENRSPLGLDISSEIRGLGIKTPRFKINIDNFRSVEQDVVHAHGCGQTSS